MRAADFVGDQGKDPEFPEIYYCPEWLICLSVQDISSFVFKNRVYKRLFLSSILPYTASCTAITQTTGELYWVVKKVA